MIGGAPSGEPALSVREWLGLGLLAIAFGLALFFNGLHIPLLSAAGVLLVGVLVLALGPGIRDGWRVPRSPSAAWLVVWWAFLAISLAWSSVVFTSSLYYWWLSALPLTFFALVLAPSPANWTRAALAGFAWAAAGLASWALVQFFVLTETYGFRAHHPLLNPNNLAGLLSLALLPLVAWYLRVRDRAHLYLALAGSLLVLAGVVATQSRGALIGLGVGLVVILVAARGAPGLNRRRLAVMAVGGLAIFLGMDWWSGAELGQRVETLGAVGAQSSFQTRLLIWESTLEMALERPWLGYGLGTFFLYYPRFRQPADTSGGYYAHMDPLQFWAELGIVGPVLFYAVLIAILVQTVRAVRRLPVGSRERLGILGPFAGMLAVAVHTHITFHLYILPTLIGLGAVLAAWQLRCERALGKERMRVALPERAHPRVWRWILAGVVALVILNLGSAGVADRFVQKGRGAVDEGEVQTALRYFHYARALTPASDTAWALGAEIRGAALSRDLGLDPRQRRALYREAHRMLDRARRRNPARAGLDHLRARLYLAAPDAAEVEVRRRAEAAWRAALAKDSRHMEARMGLANLYLSQERPQAARAVLEAGLKWPYPGPRPLGLYLRTAALRDRLGDHAGALALARSALGRIPAGGEQARQALLARYPALEGAPEEGEDGDGAP
ncbi:O-antigen ligase family protein [Thiohalorhabdus sp.]|uniref:O-antigen ligase family protein n=1 Tax=Thiohalorhabdus sp. TaxID=3094134 RepID=UPI002FC2CA8F